MKRILVTLLACLVVGSGSPVLTAGAMDMAKRAEELKTLKWGMFICWSFSTFSGKEWTPGVTDVSFFKATGCDTDQWARTAKEAGMGYILFLTKHHDGFCLWDTKTTDRKVTKSPLGRDVLAELKKSCDKHGIKLALYFSEGDWTWPGAADGKGWKAGVGRNPEIKKAQLKELLTQYGSVEYIWFDHAVGDGGLSHAETIAFCKSLQPGCFVGFNHGDQAGADIRLGEMGRPGPLDDHAAAGPHMKDAPSKSYRLAEFTYPILPPHKGGAMWFYSLPIHDGLCLPAEKLYRDYLGAVKFGNVFALDVGPDYAGRLREIDVRTLRKVGEMIRSRAPEPPEAQPPIKAFCVDFNWGPGGPNGFAKPGLWANADPVEHVAWYEQLGCNVIQTFAVSCNGYAWYRNGVVPEQPSLKHDFLREVVKLGHAKRMLVMGYFCVGANTLWGQQHPDLSYDFPSAYHIPFTDSYLDYLAASIEDALRKSGMDGFMIDWVWCPTDAVRKKATGGKWLEAEKKLYEQLLAKPFPGEDKLTLDDKLTYERKAIDRCWTRIRNAAKSANPACVIWLSCNKVHDAAIANSPMLKEVDWMMDEAGTPAAMKEVAPMFGPRTRQLLCLTGWGDRHKTREILSDPAMTAYGIYGFSRPSPDSLPLPVPTYLSQPIESFKGNDRGIATLARYFTGKPFDFATKPHAAVSRPCWHTAPTLSVMTGFIYEPLKPYTIQQWMKNLGNRFDADQWVKDFKEVGASHLVFYDKWIDGLVFHDTKTTNFKTKRDFVRELAAACQRGGLPLVLYFNAVSDGNPEFDPWSLIGLDGKPIVFGARWPTRYQTLHSPFRAKCLDQVREILGNYGPIHGIWHDIFHERFNTTSEWTARGYQKMFGEPFDKATPPQLAEFNARTLAGYLDEAEAIRRERRQYRCVFTSNGSGSSFLGGGVWTEQVGSRLQYLFNEGHSFAHNEKLARMAWALPKPLDINLLLVSSWFTPLEDAPPPASLTVEQAIAATAIAVCQGAGVNFALTPGHDGRFGEDVQRAKAVGAWFRKVQPWLEGAQPAADVGIIHGSGANAASDALAKAGVFSQWIAADQSPPALPAILVPPQSRLDERLRDYVKAGGTLIAFGNVGPLAEVFGANVKGAVRFAKKLQGATVKVDSEYSDQFAAANLLDDDPRTAWASTGTPMPHWAEVTLPEPVEVETVELISRPDSYLVSDADIELPDGSGWRVAKSIRGAKERKIVAKLDAPVKTSRVRVKILRELFNGDDRQHADVEGIRILDRSGRNYASGKFEPVRIEFASLHNLKGLSLPPPAVAVEPTTAEVLARFENPDKSPALLCNRFGKGRAYLAPSTTLSENSPFWAALCRTALGEPSLTVSADDARRFRFILTRVGESRVLHVIDAAVPAKDYRPKPVEVSLAAQRLGGVRQAMLAGGDKTLALKEKDGRLGFTVLPNPVATVVLKGAKP